MSEILVFADKSIFWDYDDPEMSIEDPDEAINDGPGCGAVMRFQVAISQPDMWGAKRYVASKDEYETAYFDNETEAENWRTEQTTNPFYAARPDVAGKRRPFDLAEFIETAVPLTAVCEAALAGERNSQNKINFTKE